MKVATHPGNFHADDVFAVADDIAVLYLGQMVAQIPTAETTRDDVVGYITGTKTPTGFVVQDTATIRTEGDS